MIEFVTKEEFDTILSKNLVVIWFTVPGCRPCRAIQPRIEEVSELYAGKLSFYRVNVSRFPEIAQKYNIMNTPTLVYFKEGREVARQDSFPSKEEIIEVIEKIRR
jgi:thioredoxin-like negative regulator of GroEL